MARELGFAHASHGELTSLTESSFDWQGFILKEELIRYPRWPVSTHGDASDNTFQDFELHGRP